jgi:hypothetical protein
MWSRGTRHDNIASPFHWRLLPGDAPYTSLIVHSVGRIARWCYSRRDQHVSMDELQSHVMPYARPRAAVATQFNVVEVPGKRECGPPASWTIESQKPCASMVLEDLSSRIARQGAN